MRLTHYLILLCLMLTTGSVVAGRSAPSPSLLAQAQERRISADEAANKVRQTTGGGRVLDVTPTDGGNAYLVRVLLSDGRVRTVRIDARTGASR